MGDEKLLPKPLFINGSFQNPWPTERCYSVWSFIKYVFSKDCRNLDPDSILNAQLPILTPNWEGPENQIRYTWIGHATVVVQIDGLTILTDPIFSNYAGPLPPFGKKRYRPCPCTIDQLPQIHAVVISHNHYDHLDRSSILQLIEKFKNTIYFFVPLGLKEWFISINCFLNVIEMNWWDKSTVPGHEGVEIILTPCQHWSKRGICDDDKSLWGSWTFVGPKHRFFYAGDTAYCDIFKLIGSKFGPFDLAAIPIGAYFPRWFLKGCHVDPEEAVKLHLDVKSKFSVAVHWGTFALAREFYLDPPMKLKDALAQMKVSEKSFVTLKHGESISIA